MPEESVVIHVCVVHHRHGEDVYVGWSRDQVEDELMEYVEQWWDEWPNLDEMPKDKDKAIDAYFSEYTEEWCEFHVCRMPPKP